MVAMNALVLLVSDSLFFHPSFDRLFLTYYILGVSYMQAPLYYVTLTLSNDENANIENARRFRACCVYLMWLWDM